MTPRRLRAILHVAMLSVWAMSMTAGQAASANDIPALPVSYAANAVAQSGAAAGKPFGVTIYVTGWTTNAEIQELAATLKSKGPNGLASAMDDKKEVGRIAPIGSVGGDFRVARIRSANGGKYHIVLVTSRPISLAEQYAGTRSREYPFGIVVLDVDKNGAGTGILAPISKIKFNKQGELEVEHYGQKPFRLFNVRLNK